VCLRTIVYDIVSGLYVESRIYRRVFSSLCVSVEESMFSPNLFYNQISRLHCVSLEMTRTLIKLNRVAAVVLVFIEHDDGLLALLRTDDASYGYYFGESKSIGVFVKRS